MPCQLDKNLLYKGGKFIYNINDLNFISSDLYKRFKKDNPSYGYLKIRAYQANEALPIEGMKIIIRTIFEGNEIIFFEGETDQSGLINKIKLPTPKVVLDNLVIPKEIIYEIEAIYPKDNIDKTYKISMYEDVCVVQNINVPPKTLEAGSMKWQ